MVLPMTTWSFAEELERFGPQGSESGPPSPAFSRRYCRRLARNTSCSEHFTLLRWILPGAVQTHVWNVAAYHGWVRGIVHQSPDAKTAAKLLHWWEEQLSRCYAGEVEHPVFVALSHTIRQFHIPADPLADLLAAARQDRPQVRFESYEQLLAYCRYAANPLGRLMLLLAGADDQPHRRLSDALCTGWQLMLFCRDLPRHVEQDRMYLPQTHCRRFGCDESTFAAGAATEPFRHLLSAELDAAEGWLQRAWPLVDTLPRPWRLAAAVAVAVGLEWIARIRRADFDLWTQPPRMSSWTRWQIAARWWWRLRGNRQRNVSSETERKP